MRLANKIIVNADDFGYTDIVNGAILRSFQRFLITNTSLLVNMQGFDNATHLVQEHAVLSGRVGVRLNFSQGYSLTPGIRACPHFCHKGGYFNLRSSRRILFLTRREKQAIYAEMKAQLEKALMAGIQPSHLDTRHSMHLQYPMAAALARLGKEYGIPRMRFFHNLGPEMRGVKGAYRRLFNRWACRSMGVSVPDLSGKVEDLLSLPDKRKPEGKFIEITVAPTVDAYGELVDRNGKVLQTRLRPVLDHRHTLSYADLPLPSVQTSPGFRLSPTA